ncbi:UNVERIFIED_CONTAM: hypothetical protein Sangu_2466400 [Sesamum angustifolium]|uniref:MHD domain-containing protein n=1 Tax=Sesamum angustifolium TaxID=2727405 RepID=A0AAW2J3P9_9LAMI
MSCLALALQPANGPDILLQTREWFPPSRALMALSAFRETRLAFAKNQHQPAASSNFSSDPSSDSLGDDPLAASSGQVIVGVESRYRVVYRLVNSIYVLAVTVIEDSNNNVFECIHIVNQAVSVVVTACRGVDVTPEKLGKKYAEIYMALDIVLRGVSSIRLAAMLASMHGDGIAKMVHSAVQTEMDHEAGVESFSHASFELPAETLQAGDEVAAATLVFFQQGEEKEVTKVEESEAEKDPFAASDRINKPEEMLMEGFKREKILVFQMAEEGSEGPGLGGLEFLETSEPPAAAVAKAGGEEKIEDILVKKTEMKGPEYDKETEFSFKVEGTDGVKRFAVQSSRVSSLGSGLFHVRTAPSQEPIPIIKYSLLPRMTPLPIRIRLVKRLSGTLLSVMIQYVSNPNLPVPLNNVTIVLKLPVDPTLLKVSPKAVLNRSERELKWHIDEIPLKGNPGRLRARMPLEIGEDDDGSDLEIFGYVKFSAQGTRSLSGLSLRPASEGKTDFYETDHSSSLSDIIDILLGLHHHRG